MWAKIKDWISHHSTWKGLAELIGGSFALYLAADIAGWTPVKVLIVVLMTVGFIDFFRAKPPAA